MNHKLLEKGITACREHTRLQRDPIVLKKARIYLNREDGERYELLEYLDEHSQVMIRNLKTQQSKIASIYQLENLHVNKGEDTPISLSAIGDQYWEKSSIKYEAIKPLLNAEQYNPTSVKQRAKVVNVNERTLYRWLHSYNSVGSISGLIDKKRGWKIGRARLNQEQDTLMSQIINEFYLNEQRPTIEQTIREVQRIASIKGVSSPSRQTIRKRILQLSESTTIEALATKIEPMNISNNTLLSNSNNFTFGEIE